MRVVFIGRSHPFSLLPLSSIAAEHDVVGVVESAPRGSGSGRSARARRRLHTVRARRGSADSLPRRARLHHAAYLWLDRESKPALAPLLRDVRADVICVASLSYLLPEDVLTAATFGAVNLHPSLLPLYHGPFPWFWQYHDFRLDIGVTVHQLDQGQDTGPILAQEPLRLELGTDIHDAMNDAGALGATMMRSVLRSLEDGTAKATPQSHGDIPKARVVTRTERFIDWDEWPLDRIWHFMRGTYPWVDHVDRPAELGGGYRVGTMERCATDGVPGTLGQDADGWFVAHREGRIRLLFTPVS